MEINYTLLVTLFLVLIVVHCAGSASEGEGSTNTGLGQKISAISNQNNSLDVKKGGPDLDLDSKKVDPIKKGKEQVEGLREGVENTNSHKIHSSNQLDAKGAQNVQGNTNNSDSLKEGDKKEKADEGSESKKVEASGVQTVQAYTNNSDSVKEGDKKEKADEGSESKKVPNEEILQPVKDVKVEECDSSNKCTDEKNALVACLRVPGNESPDLLLLIQNKGKGPLSVTISASDFVRPKQTQIQLQEKQDTKVTVSIKTGGTDSLIVLTAGNGNCSLDFRDLIAHSFRKEADNTPQSAFIKLFKQTPTAGFIFLAALLVMASIWKCVSFRRKRYTSYVSKYQKLDIELPVSGGGKTKLDDNEGWDNSWGDGWDDVEAPKTSSVPITPNFSSKGVSSRRVNKEARKD